MNKGIRVMACFLLPCACASVDMDKRAKSGIGNTGQTGPLIAAIETAPPPPEIITLPVYVPEAETVKAAPSGRAAVEEAAAEGIISPQDYSHAAMIYDFHPDQVYEVYTQPLRVTDIRLEPGEQVVEKPFFSDSDRWMPGAGVHHELGMATQHIYVKPKEAALSATLIINTDRRVYHIILRSYRDTHMPMVRWRYPGAGLPQRYAASPRGQETGDGAVDPALIDPRFLSFNYRLTYGLFGKPKWLPELVYDDGKKTYVSFPDDTLRTELPAVFENRSDVLNYRVLGNLLIIDKLIETITVRIAKKEILIEKKKG
jgi:type IV secretion system protein VirB9